MSSSKKKILLIFLSVLILVCAVITSTLSLNARAQEEGTYTSYVTPQNPTFSLQSYSTKKGEETIRENIENKQYVLLEQDGSYDNYHKICFDIQSDSRTSKYIIRLVINAYLNGNAINVDVQNKVNANLQGGTYENYLNFEISRQTSITYQNIYDIDNNQATVTDLQGHYEFYFSLNLYDTASGITITEPANYNWYKYEFTVIDQDQYANVDQLPTLNNVDDLNANEYINCYSYTDNLAQKQYGYAQLKFDAERYKIIMNRTFEGKTTTIESRFAYYTDNNYTTQSPTKTDYGKVFFVYPDKTVSFNIKRNNNKLFIFDEKDFTYNSSKTDSYTQPLFYDLGEYTINKYYQIYQDGELLYDNSLNSPVALESLSLVVYGVNLNYAYNLTSTKYFINFSNNTVSTDFTNAQTEKLEDIEIPSTNQAPVWFNTQAGIVNSIKFYHALTKSALYSSLDQSQQLADIASNNSIDWQSVNKNYYFTEAGYYFVVCDYQHNLLNATQNTQIFLFQIKSNTPDVTLKAKNSVNNTVSNLVSGGFTNGNVYLYMDKEGIFDSEVKTQYSLNTNFSSTFTNYIDFTPQKGEGDSYTTFTIQGKYSIKVMFGQQSTSYYTFTIDKTDVKNYVNAYTLSQKSTRFVASTNITDKTIINSYFTVIIQEKPSKATISATLTTVDIESYEPNQTQVYTTNNSVEYINARYRATYASSPNSYANIVNNTSSYIDNKYVFKEHKIYIFQVTDSAGFSYVHIVYLDKANANLLQYDANDQLVDITDYNIVSSKTKLVWSSNKAIEFVDHNTLGDDASRRNIAAISLLSQNSYFDYNGTTFVLLTPISNINITSTNLNGTTTPNISGNLYTDYSNSKQITVYGLSSEAIADGVPTNKVPILSGEKIYTIKITDASGITTNYSIEVNMDKSLGKAYTMNTSAVNYKDYGLSLEGAGSLDFLVFEWKDDEENSPFAIESLTYEFYPLTYDNTQSFPYAETSTKSGDLLTGALYNTPLNLYYSTPINTTQIKYYDYNASGALEQMQKTGTEAGKYVITRTYKGSGNLEDITDTGDTLVRTYTYYVDRNPIIDYPQSNLIPANTSNFTLGGGIKLLFGDQQKTFNEFYREPTSSIDVVYANQTTTTKIYLTLESNLLPIKVKVPQNKYSRIAGSSAITPTSVPGTFNLVVTLQKFDMMGNLEFEKVYNQDYAINPQVDSNGYISVDDITTDGYYLMKIQDNSLLANKQVSPNMNTIEYFAFYVNLSGPQASIVSSNQPATVAGESPLSMEILSTGYYKYTAATGVASVQTTYRDLDINRPNTSLAFSQTLSPWSSERQLQILGANNTIRQYRFEVSYLDETKANTIHYSPLYTDYNTYNLNTSGSATKDNYIVLKFDEPSEEYMASIDFNDITIDRYEKINGVYSSKVTLVYNQDFILQQRYNPITKKVMYSIQFFSVDEENPSKEYRYDVTYHFIGNAANYQTKVNNQIVSYYSSTQTIYVDKTAPTYNITRLASLSANSAMLSAINGKAYTSDYYKDSNGTYYYANVSNFDFAIDSTFAFTRPTISSGAVDTQEGTQLYFRKYNKYDEDSYATTNKNQAYQAIVPGDTEYISGTSAKLRFSTQNTTLWKSFVYNTSFVEQLKREYNTTNMASLYGYYEIVEIDAVGNHSIYTVLFNEKSPTFTFNYNASNGANEAIYPNASAQNPNAISSYNSIELISINSVDDWYRITVDNYLNLIVTPSGDINEVISAINAALDRGKNIYLLTISNRFGNDVTVSVIINFSAETFSVTSSNTHDNEGYYTVYFEEDKDGLIMSKVRVQKFNSDTKTFVDMVNNSNQAIDSAEQVINVTEKRYYLFTEGIYKFFIEDNFNYGANATVVTLNVGNSGTNYSLTFDGGKINYQGKIYTTQNVTLVASPERYTISATRNGSSIDVTTENFVFSAPNEGIEANVSSGGEYKYVVSILDNVTGESIVEEFIIYNFFPAVNATNSKGENMDKLLATNKSSVSSFTSDSVYLTYSANGYTFGYSFILRKYDNLSSTAYTIVNTGANGTTVYAKAAYELVITNTTLNSTRSVWFVIRESTISMYSVVERLPNGTLNELTPSQTLLDITGYRTQIKTYLSNKGKEYNFGSTLSVKNYFTIYDFEVTVDGDKGLTTNWGIEGDSIVYTSTTGGMSNSTYIVVVYGSSPYNYLDIFALTKVSSNSRFLESISYSYETTQTLEDGTKTTETVNVTVDSSQFDNVSVYENPITVSWASYYYINLNKVYMTYSYNGKTIGTISPSNLATTSIVFNDDGEYKLWFNDLAGNKMLFGETSSNEFTITIKSIVKTLVNDDLPIYGAVYNGEVNFEIYEPGDYTQLSADVYINGIFQKDIKISKNSAKATFTTVGFYKIIVSGSIRTSTSAVKALSNNEIVFTIINPNESKFAYEFASISGYEITSVKKNGFDITDDIRGNNAGIYSLVLSEDINGIGKYSVTIHADFVNSLRESEDFTFDVWINNKTPSLDCNTRRNETSVNTIVITYNPKALYEQLGSCKIVIGAQEFEINENAMKEEGNKTLSIDVAGTYYITLVTESGNIISIYKVTKQDPLNTLSIILIVLGVGLAIGAGYLFYRLRIKMKIK